MSWIDPLPDEDQAWRAAPLTAPGGTGAPRRDPNVLPEQFRERLIRHYLDFAVRQAMRNSRAVQLYLPEPDDLRQQAAVWILEAAATYDVDRAPFPGYLAHVLSLRVLDLARAAMGRTTADAAIRLARAGGELSHRLGRAPTLQELADALEVPYSAVAAWELVLRRVTLPPQSLSDDSGELAAAATQRREEALWHVADPAALVDDRLYHAAVLRALLVTGTTPEGDREPLGLVGFLLTAYGQVSKTGLAAAADVPFKRLARRMAELSRRVRRVIDET